jgi:hypothetical protein
MEKGTLPLLMGMQISIPTMKSVLRFLKKVTIELPYDLAMILLDIYVKEYNGDTSTPVFIAALFIVARLWN